MISRRGFLKGGAIGMAAIGAAGLSGCTSAAPLPQTGTKPKNDWLGTPEIVSESGISKVVDCDVVVVGAGVAGSSAALSAVEEGAHTVLIEKSTVGSTPATWIGAVNTSLYANEGIVYDEEAKADIVNDLMWHANYRADQRLIKLWIEKSGEAVDWYCERCVSDGTMSVVLETDLKETNGKHLSPAIAHVPIMGEPKEFGPNEAGLRNSTKVLVNLAVSQGLELYENTTGKYLLTSEDGFVTGIVATDADGNHIQFNASKGVILCTGGYMANGQMREALNPIQHKTTTVQEEMMLNCTGDGIKMGLWANGYMNDLHWWMENERGLPSGRLWKPGTQPWLRTDCWGNRFCNEDAPYDYNAYSASLNPGHHYWVIWDENYWEDIERFGTTICSRLNAVRGAANTGVASRSKEEFYERWIKPYIESGEIVTGSSLDELVEQMKTLDDRINGETLKATVERYNELSEIGMDEDFGKLAFRLSTVKDAPFYATWLCGYSICNLDGLRINENIECITEDGVAIPGLYAAGNDTGGYYGISYPWYYGGLNCGFGVTFGYLAGKNAASRKI